MFDPKIIHLCLSMYFLFVFVDAIAAVIRRREFLLNHMEDSARMKVSRIFARNQALTIPCVLFGYVLLITFNYFFEV